MIFVFEQIRRHASFKDAMRDFAMYAIGLGAAGGLFGCWLAANGINLNLAFACIVQYNSLYNIQSGFGHGLLHQIVSLPVLTLPILVAFLSWTIHCFRTKSFPAAYPAALALWLPIQAVLVSYPYKQYYGPWFLFASGFFPFFYSALVTFTKRTAPTVLAWASNHTITKLGVFSRYAATAVFFGLCSLSISESAVTAHTWFQSHELQNHEDFLRTINKIANPEDYIISMPPLHPVDRRDTFYVCFNTLDPAGHDTEEILGQIPLLCDFVSDEYYREELRAHPPALVVFWSDQYPRRQIAVINEFLQERGYISSAIENVTVAVRPDRSERFLQQTH